MKVVGDFNNLSSKLRPAKLRPGQVAEYQMIHGKPANDGTGRMIYPAVMMIATRDRIWDPFKKVEGRSELGDYVDIGVVDQFEKDKVISTKIVWFGPSGKMGCTGGIVDHEELYEFMELSSENADNPYRNPAIDAKYTRVDVVKEAKGKVGRRSDKLEAMLYASQMDEAQKREFAAAMNWNELDDITVITNRIEDFAETKSKAFTDFLNEPDLKDKGIIKNAISKGILAYDSAAHRMLWAESGTVIATLERRDGATPVELFAEWLRTTGGGGNTMAGIRKKVMNAIKEATKPVEVS